MDGEEEGAAADKLASSEELYFTKEGRLKPGKAPTAFAWTYPWPPSPTNLNKNKVFRPTEEQNQEVLKQAKETFEKEAKPLNIPEEINTLGRMPVPDIELALYWDRHPYEFRPAGSKPKERSKSAMNLSSVGDLLNNETSKNSSIPGSRKSSADSGKSRKSRSSSASPQIRKNSNASISTVDKESVKLDNQLQSSHNPSDNQKNNKHGKEGSRGGSNSPSRQTQVSSKLNGNSDLPKILQVLSTNEKRKLEDIKRPSQSARGRDSAKQEEYRRPYTVRDLSGTGNSIGVQASLDEISSAALMSTYLCPLHGQYHKGIERRNKNGFRTDMSSTANPHARCSRSRTKLVMDTEIQTEDTNGTNYLSGNRNKSSSRSKTAGPRSRGRSSGNMLSEYNGNYKHPAKIADSENRRLRNKILSYCFTKHSIF